MKVEFNGKVAKVKIESEERIEITLPSGKVIRVESFASPDYDDDHTMLECVIAPKENKRARETSQLNNYTWSNQRKDRP